MAGAVRVFLCVAGAAGLVVASPQGRVRADDGAAARERKDAAEPAPSAGDVDRAVARGVKFLLSEQRADGGFGTTAGETGLALWALRHSGTGRDDRAARRAAERLERDLPDGTTYGTSLGVCGLLAHDAVRHRERIQKSLDALARGQCENGQWTYLTKANGRKVGDNSNTQCAVLALGAARLRGFRVADEVFDRVLAFADRTQNEDGGWGYAEAQQRASYGGMTAGMLMVRGLARGVLRGVDPASGTTLDDPESKRALAWLAEHFDPARNPGSTEWRTYWLWSVERAGVLCGFTRVGDRDWFPEGARVLVERQSRHGAWTEERTIPDTCWALLFLRRGTTSVITPGEGERSAETPGGKDAETRAGDPSRREDAPERPR